MKKINQISLACALALCANATDDLGVINIESSTVNVIESSKATEASTISYIDEQKIQETGAKNVGELLKGVPGVTADIRAGEVVEIHMRGVGQQEFMGEDTGVAVIVDGVPVYAKSGKFRLNISDIKSIKVIKGSASYLYGNTATGGAIIITTSRPKGSKNEFSLGAEYGIENYRDYNIDFNHSNENFAVNLNANDRSTDGYWVDSAYWSKSYGGKFTYYLDDTSDVTLGIDKTTKFEGAGRTSVTGVTAAENDPDGSETASSFQKDNNVELDKYFLKYNKDFNNGGNLLVNVYKYLDEYDFQSSPQDEDLAGNPMASTYSNHSLEHKKQKGAKIEYKQELDKLAFLLGYEYGDRKYLDASQTLVDYSSISSRTGLREEHYEGETSETEDNQKLHAYYGELKYAFTPQFTTTFNIRHDKQTDEYLSFEDDYDGVIWNEVNQGIEKTFKQNSYRLGGVYNFNDNYAVFGNYSTGFRTPQVKSILDNEENGFTNTIDVQKSRTYEIGTRGNFSNFNYEVTLFQIDTKDIIGREFGTYAFLSKEITNIGDSQNRGIELALNSKPTDNLSIDVAYTYLRSKFTDHLPVGVRTGYVPSLHSYSYVEFADVIGNEVPRVPHHKINIYTTYEPIKNLKLISELYAQSSYYADETNDIKMPGYATLNLQARYNMKIGDHNFEFFAKVNNVFDKRFYQSVYFTSDNNHNGVYDSEDPSITVDPGRQYFAGIKYTF